MGRPRSCECNECQKCRRREYMREWYQQQTPEKKQAIVQARDPEKVKRTDRARYYRSRAKRRKASDEYQKQNPEKVRAAKRRWAKANPEKIRAQGMARRAMLRGEIVKTPCEICGEERVHMHHNDYSKPHEVRWLCVAHHGEVHRKVT